MRLRATLSCVVAAGVLNVQAQAAYADRAALSMTSSSTETAITRTIESNEESLERILDRVRSGDIPRPRQLLDGLEAAGQHGARDLFAAMGSRADGREPLSSRSVAALEQALRQVPIIIVERLTGENSRDRRLVLAGNGLVLLERLADTETVASAFDLAAPHEATSRRDHRGLRNQLVKTLSTTLRRERNLYPVLRKLTRELTLVQRAALFEAVGSAPSPAALRFLVAQLGEAPLDGIVLTQLGLVARDIEVALGEPELMRVRPYLTSSDPNLRTQAAQTVGRLDDFGSVQSLIALLSDEQAKAREMAHWSLRSITAMTYTAEPNRWNIWFQQESRWWEEKAHAVIERMRSRHVVEAIDAMNEVAGKRLFRRQLTPELLPLLQDRDPRIVRMACSALLSLRAVGVEGEVSKLLDHPDAEVRTHAQKILSRLIDSQASSDSAGNDR